MVNSNNVIDKRRSRTTPCVVVFCGFLRHSYLYKKKYVTTMNWETSLLGCRRTINRALDPIVENKLARNKNKM